jgi:Na+/melibiose symporter-like transporter
MMLDSMMADVVEDSEIHTDRRSEGLFFATRSFGAKAISAGGIFSAGFILTLVGMDSVSSVVDMTMEHRVNLAMLFLPLWCLLNLVAIGLVSRYRIGRKDHESNLQQLDVRRGPEPSSLESSSVATPDI